MRIYFKTQYIVRFGNSMGMSHVPLDFWLVGLFKYWKGPRKRTGPYPAYFNYLVRCSYLLVRAEPELELGFLGSRDTVFSLFFFFFNPVACLTSFFPRKGRNLAPVSQEFNFGKYHWFLSQFLWLLASFFILTNSISCVCGTSVFLTWVE